MKIVASSILFTTICFASWVNAQDLSKNLSSLKSQLIQFKQIAKDPNQCLVYSNQVKSAKVSLLKHPKKGGKTIAEINQGQTCKILKTTENKKGEVWMEVEITPLTGWLAFDQVVQPASVFPIGKGKRVILVFRPECKNPPCPTSHWIIQDTHKKYLDMQHGHFVVDEEGDNIFYDQLIKTPYPEMKNRFIWKSAIFRYQISQNQLNRIGSGISPTLHPKKKLVFYRDLGGKVLSADYAGALVRAVFTPKESERVHQDEQEGLKLPPVKLYSSGTEAIVPQKIALYRDPRAGTIPPPVEFIDDHTIKFYVLYDNGRIKATQQIRVN